MAAACAIACSATAHAADPDDEQDALSIRGVAGEILDVAVEHCRRGERGEALAMFTAIREQLDPPPAIRQLILEMEATGCHSPAMAQGGSLRLQVGGGWDSNVSQGITARTLVLGSGADAIELELDPSYRPRSAHFLHAMADYSLLLPRYGANLQFALGQRVNFGASEFDLRTVSAAAGREFTLPVGSLRAQLDWTEIWLGERHYQRTGGLQLQWLHNLPRGAWLGTLQGTSVRYLTQPQQDAVVWEASLLREWRLAPAYSIHAALSAQRDDARGARPGGDRAGYQVSAGAVALTHGWRVRPQVSYTDWRSDDIFAPGLLDLRRRNRLTQLSLHAERPLAQNTSLVLEWRGRRSRDSIALYRYSAQSINATLAFRF